MKKKLQGRLLRDVRDARDLVAQLEDAIEDEQQWFPKFDHDARPACYHLVNRLIERATIMRDKLADDIREYPPKATAEV